MEVRPFRDQSDVAACLAVFDSNLQDLGGEAGREAFASFLSRLPDSATSFTLLEHEGNVVGCGGFTVDATEPHIAVLRWAMVRQDLRRKGLGRYLLLFRLKQIGAVPGVQFVEAQVPRHLASFYEKCGLKSTGIASTSGGDAMLHRMKLQVCAAS